MKNFKTITRISLIITVIAIIAVMCNLFSLYNSEKHRTMQIVGECAVNAELLEMVSRMKSGEDAGEAFIRLNHIIEMNQQKDGRLAKSDTLRTSLGDLMRMGLEFNRNQEHADRRKLDSIFSQELHRHGLFPQKAFLIQSDSTYSDLEDYWSIGGNSVPGNALHLTAYVSPLRGKVLSQMWGIIIPLSAVILTFAFLSSYMIRYVRRLRTIEQMKDDFTHNMTHELKTPVAVAYSAADSILRYYDQSDAARNKQFLNIIMQRLSHLSGLIENILSVSMERFKTIRLKMETVHIKPMVCEVARMFELKADKPLQITVDIPDDFYVTTDATHFCNIISNLIDNAIKYSGASVNIKIKTDGNTLTVVDNGFGIAPRHLPYIFDKFYRATTGDRYETGGYGLGLFYVKQITDLLGWKIYVSSKPGAGAKFTLKIHCYE